MSYNLTVNLPKIPFYWVKTLNIHLQIPISISATFSVQHHVKNVLTQLRDLTKPKHSLAKFISVGNVQPLLPKALFHLCKTFGYFGQSKFKSSETKTCQHSFPSPDVLQTEVFAAVRNKPSKIQCEYQMCIHTEFALWFPLFLFKLWKETTARDLVPLLEQGQTFQTFHAFTLWRLTPVIQCSHK